MGIFLHGYFEGRVHTACIQRTVLDPYIDLWFTYVYNLRIYSEMLLEGNALIFLSVVRLYPKWSALNEIIDILNIKMEKVQLSQQSKGRSLFLNKFVS